MHSNESVQQKMFSLIAQWQQSDLTQKLFCQQNEIPYHVFHYWYGRYRKLDQGTDATPRFIKLAVSSDSKGYAELILPNGKRLLIHQPVPSDYLKMLIA